MGHSRVPQYCGASGSYRQVMRLSPNKHMQRPGRHRVPGRGRVSLVPWSRPRARVLTGRRAGADVNR
jgi:hypothetical protein